MASSILVPAAQLIGITGGGFATGAIFAVSRLGMPAISLAPVDLLVKQWRDIYETGKALMPPLVFVCATSFAYLAYMSRDTAQYQDQAPAKDSNIRLPSKFTLYALAAVTVPMIVPYTIAVMDPVANRQLTAASDAVRKGLNIGLTEQAVRDLIGKWTRMNYMRALITGCATFVGAVAVLAM